MSLIHIGVEGQDMVEKLLLSLLDQNRLTKILDEATAALFARQRARFLQAKDPDGHGWKESMAAKDRRLKGVGGLTLFDTGRLFHSLQIYREGPDGRSIGTDVPYGKFHQFGKRGWQFLGFSTQGPDSDVQLAEDITLLRIQEALEL